jgi:hypothetical protein
MTISNEYTEEDGYVPGEPIAVRLAKIDVPLSIRRAPDYGSCMTWPIAQVGQGAPPTQILTRRIMRYKAKLIIVTMGGATSIIFGSKQDPLTNPVPQGFTVSAGDGLGASVEGSVTSPGANSNIASFGINQVIPGSYTVQWTVELDGTPGAGDVDNFRLRYNAINILTSVNDGAIGRYPQNTVQLTAIANPAGALLVQSIAAGTAGAVYSAQMTVTPAGLALPFKLPDWESQQPLYAIAVGGSPTVAVIDETYADG